MVKKVDLQPSHLGLGTHGCRFEFLLLKKYCRDFPYHITFKKKILMTLLYNSAITQVHNEYEIRWEVINSSLATP
jgi:hypothetical protein